MKKYRTNLGIITVISLLSIICFSATSFAEETTSELDEQVDDYLRDPYTEEGNLSLGRCISKGNIDFLLFLNGLTNFEGITDGYFEPVYDIVTRNQCQATDIYNLIKQRDKIRGYIRDAFLTCNNQKLPKYEKAYFELNAEIYYARHIVEGNIVVNLPFELLTTRMIENPESLFTSRDELYGKMKGKYVDTGKFEKKDFDNLFLRIEGKYKERKKNYVICENSSWEVVQQKWDEFIENAGGVGPAVENFEEGIGRGAEKIVEAAKEPFFLDYLSGIVQLNINDVTPAQGVSDIIERLSKSMPDIGTPTQYTVFETYAAEADRYNTDLMRSQMVAGFMANYMEGSDASLELFLTELQDLEKTINDSLDPIDMTLSCTNAINLRQCPGSYYEDL